jgi:D-beta-D-heptose 7-phosphate kinase/D-beta-D-heptose 1-phosphate adenosyltransferase
MNAVEEFIKLSKKISPRIALVGDLMVDEYHDVDANRVSPEFPVPVMRSPHASYSLAVPGGVGNVACQFRHFNVDLQLYAMLDAHAKCVLEQEGISTQYCYKFPDNISHVPLKRRYYHGDFPLCRWDVEEENYGTESLGAYQLALYRGYMNAPKPEVMVLSDYNKGTLVGPLGKKQWLGTSDDVIKIVDPKRPPLEDWEGCSVFKPNRQEAEVLSGVKQWKKQCDYFQDKLHCLAVVITQGGDGVVGKVDGRYFEFTPQKNVVANSVIGAGDAFIAFLAMGLCYSMDIVQAVEVAFEAGAVYVQNKHNKPITPYDLLKHVNSPESKFVDINFLKNRDYTLAWSNGCYDIMHMGHIDMLNFAKSKADKLAVGIDVDESVRNHKGANRPINPLEQRMRTLSALECVDFVIPYSGYDPTDIIKEIRPEVLVKGADWEGKSIKGSEYVGKVEFCPFNYDTSTTKIIEKILRTHHKL